jgi:hypothetical protein
MEDSGLRILKYLILKVARHKHEVTLHSLPNYDSTALLDLGSCFSSLIYTQPVDSSDGGSARNKAAFYTHNNNKKQ